MAQLTLRTLLAYIDDTLEPAKARELGAKVAESELARELIEKIKRVTRRRGLKTPTPTNDEDDVSDPNTIAEYLSNSLDSEQVTRLEETCLQSDAHLAEVAACHQILTLILTEPVRVPPQARSRMYRLVQPPASSPGRRPGKTISVGSTMPEPPDSDDADTTLLLGFGRYSAASLMKRVAAVAAVVGLCGCLAVAVLLALPGRPPAPPPVDHHSYAEASKPRPPVPGSVSPPKVDPESNSKTIPSDPDSGPKPKVEPKVEPVPKPKPKVEPKVEPVPKPKPKPKKGNADLASPPRLDRAAIGKVEGVNTLVVTRADNSPNWQRLDPADNATVVATDQVLCLPGFKADVALDGGVKVHMWGNVPDLLPARFLESRVRFYRPERKLEDNGTDFDADLALLAGRIYLSTTKAAGCKVRVRFGKQIWDLTLPDSKSEAMFEVITSFPPGVAFARGGGPPPRVEAQAAIIRGTATLAMPLRSKTFDKIASPRFISWDSQNNTLADPKPIDPTNGYYDRFLLVGSEQGKAVQKALSDMASRLKDRSGIRNMLAEILTEPPDPARIVASQMAVYSQAAIVSGTTAPDELKPLVDLLEDEMKGYARLATIYALAPWLAQAPGNTAILGKVLVEKLRSEQDAETVLRLLRGYVAPDSFNPSELVALVKYLNHPSVAIRELALWNLVTFVDPGAAKTPGLITDVALKGMPAYDKFLKAWDNHIKEVIVNKASKK